MKKLLISSLLCVATYQAMYAMDSNNSIFALIDKRKELVETLVKQVDMVSKNGSTLEKQLTLLTCLETCKTNIAIINALIKNEFTNQSLDTISFEQENKSFNDMEIRLTKSIDILNKMQVMKMRTSTHEMIQTLAEIDLSTDGEDELLEEGIDNFKKDIMSTHGLLAELSEFKLSNKK